MFITIVQIKYIFNLLYYIYSSIHHTYELQYSNYTSQIL